MLRPFIQKNGIKIFQRLKLNTNYYFITMQFMDNIILHFHSNNWKETYEVCAIIQLFS